MSDTPIRHNLNPNCHIRNIASDSGKGEPMRASRALLVSTLYCAPMRMTSYPYPHTCFQTQTCHNKPRFVTPRTLVIVSIQPNIDKMSKLLSGMVWYFHHLNPSLISKVSLFRLCLFNVCFLYFRFHFINNISFFFHICRIKAGMEWVS